MSSIFGLFLLATSVAFAQDKPKPDAPTPPVLTETQKLEFFKAQAEFQSAAAQAKGAEQAAQQKQATLQTAIKGLTDACGKDFAPSIDTKGYPVCVAKPEPEAKK